MNGTPGLEDQLGEFLEDGPTAARARVLELVLATIPSIPQRRVSRRVPWRVRSMPGYARALALVAACVVIAAGGLMVLSGSSAGRVGQRPPAVAPSRSPSGSGGPTATPVDTSGWTSFSSTRNGLTIRHPAGWTVTAATAPWPVGTDYPQSLPSPMLDVLGLPTNGNWTFYFGSQPLAAGVSGTAWLTTYELKLARYYADMPQCFPPPSSMRRTTVDGQTAWIHEGCGFIEAIAFVGGRVYVLTWLSEYDPDMFDALLSTIRFTAAAAHDAPSSR